MTPTPPPKPTLIFVPGGWHVPAHYQPTTALLTARGFKTICVHNPSSRNDPPWPQHYSYDTAAVAAHILAETALDNDVLVIMHSYGGFPGGAACEGLLKSERAKGGQKGGVVGVVYVSAFALDADVSLADLGDRVGPWPWIQPDPATENLTLRVTDTSVFYNDVPDDLRATAIKLIHRFPSQVLGGKQVYAPWKHVAATYIICEDDLALTPPSQEWFAGQAGGKWTVERIKAGHSPFLSQPENLAGLVIRAAEKAVAESE